MSETKRARDPRWEPMPGDILKRGSEYRRVTYYPDPQRPAHVRYTEGIHDSWAQIKKWRRWAETAEVTTYAAE